MSIRQRIANFIGGKVFSSSSILSTVFSGFGWNPAKNPEVLIKKIRGWSYACITKNSQAVAQVPLRLYRVKGGSNKQNLKTAVISKSRGDYLQTKLSERISGSDVLEEVTEHPILDLLRSVNPRQNAFDLKEVTVKYLEAIGVSYWYLERGVGDAIINIFPLFSQYIKVVLNEDKTIKEYLYKKGTNEIHFAVEDIVHFKYSSMTDPFVGDSPLVAGEQSVDLNFSMNNFEIASFKNGMSPGTILEVPTDSNLNEPERKRIQSEFRRNHAGVGKSGKLVVTSGGATLKEFGFSPKDMSFTKGRQTTLEETCGVFGVPLSFVKPDQVSRANLWGSMFQWMQFTINPKLVMIEQKLNEQFTPNFGEGLFLLFDDARPVDEEFRLKQITANLASKYSYINEERGKDGLDPVPWGDEPVEFEMDVTPIDEPEPKKDKREGATNDLPEPDFVPVVFVSQLNILFGKMKASIIKNMENFDKSIETKVTSEDMTGAIFDSAFWGERIAETSMPFIKGLLEMAIAESLEKLDTGALFNSTSPAIVRALEERRALIKTVSVTVEKELRSEISDSILAGESRSQQIKRIRSKFNTRSKADRVVRTETIWAHNEGTVQAWEQSGVVTGKKWDTVPDDRRCPYCASMDGKTIDLSGRFFEKGDSLTVKDPDSDNDITLNFGYEDVKHPPLHPNCRCQLIPIIID